jgi:hypothetical protein
VNSQQAKQVLSTYRPWADATNPAFAEALVLVRADEDLRRWFDTHCATQSAIRTRLQGITIPPGLKEQILSEHHSRQKVVWLRQPAMLAAAAIVAILVSLAALWNLRPAKEREDLTLAGYRNRMVRTAVRTYSMDLETNSVPEIRSYLAQHQAHADFKAPATLDRAPAVGCGVLSWQGNRVSMVCFHSGQTLAAGQKADLLLFVVDRNALPDAPPEDTPVVAAVGKVVTTSWSDGNKTYVLAKLENDAAFRQPH